MLALSHTSFSCPSRYDPELSLVRALVEGVVKELVISAGSSDSVKRALLGRGAELAVLFGRRDLNDKVQRIRPMGELTATILPCDPCYHVIRATM